ncbi:MAG: DHA2 family efflux MFS transporter permease subunit [Caulobacterales bacterium]
MALEQDRANRVPISVAVILATLMNTIDGTIANVALPHIQGSVSAAQDQITWVLTSYIIATAIMTPLSGWLSMRIGRKRMFQFSIFAFTIASMLCGIATTLPEIVLFRFLQGLAGASMMPLSQGVILDLYTPRELPTAMSLWSAAIILGPIIGPTLGGWLTDTLSWRWVFFINLPVGILAFLGVTTFMSTDRGGRERPFDALGFTALVLFIGGLQLMFDRGPSQDWLSSKEIWIEGGLAAIGLYIFVVQTATAEHPFFDRALLHDGNFVSSTFFSFFVGMLLFSSSALLPLMMQNYMGYSVLETGFANTPRGIGSFIAFLFVGQLVLRFDARLVLAAGLAISAFGLWEMTHFDLAMTSAPIMVTGFIQGVGIGLIFMPLNTMAYSRMSPDMRAEGTTVNTLVRSLGSALGISIVQASWTVNAAVAHSDLTGHVQLADPVFRAGMPQAFDPSSSGGAVALNGEITRQSGMVAYVDVFLLMFMLTIAIAPLILIMRAPQPVGGPVEVPAE